MIARLLLRHQRVLFFALIFLVCLGGYAEGRVGGGQSYGGGSSSGSSGGGYSSSGSSGGGSGDIEGFLRLIEFLIWLCVEHPYIGFPLLLISIVGGFIYYSKEAAQKARYAQEQQERAQERWKREAEQKRRLQEDKRAFLSNDPGYSEPLFLDYIQLVYTKIRRQSPDKQPALRAFASKNVLDKINAKKVYKDIIFGKIELGELYKDAKSYCISSIISGNRMDIETGIRYFFKEKLVWKRAEGLRSLEPLKMRSVCCPSCGSNEDITLEGTCPSCDQVRIDGALQWELVDYQSIRNQKLSPISHKLGGMTERGYRARYTSSLNLATELRAFHSKYPTWSQQLFFDKVRYMYQQLQKSWSDREWGNSRSFQTDGLFQVHLFWMQKYKEEKLYNRNDVGEIEKIEIVNMTQDLWIESISVRIWANMHDWTEKEGAIISGSKTQQRKFSEIWVFIRSVGATTKAPTAAECPSCGAPLDNISMAGICGYCEGKVCSGDFDWVLSRIEQID